MAVDVKTFATELARSLTARGIPKELAIKHAVSLVRTFDEEDLREISSYTDPEEFAELSNSLADLIKDKEMTGAKAEEKSEENKEAPDNGEAKKEEVDVDKTIQATRRAKPARRPEKPTNPSATEEFRLPRRSPDAPSMDATIDLSAKRIARPVEEDDGMRTRAFSIDGAAPAEAENATITFDGIKTGDISLRADLPHTPAEAENTVIGEQEIYLDDDGTLPEEPGADKIVLSGRGKAVFWGVSIGTLPITLFIAAVVLGIFALGIATVCALMVASIGMLCVEAVAGCGCTLVGVIYGAIELISGHGGVGLYEIGLGIACGGLAMFLSILTYNLAVAALPYILKQLIAFEGYCLKGVGPMIRRFREECGKL